jgi:2-(1,2-epoxy-1,2-dihydrophenyl)acetyl-CoA isomerase
MNNNLEQQLALESDLQIEASSTNDYNEGVTAFVEKRKPEFKGN